MISEGQRRGSLFAPIHWSDETASSGRVGEMVTPATDPFSGQPEAKATPAAISAADFKFHGFALTRERIALPTETWWSRVAIGSGTGLLMASNQPPLWWQEHARTLFRSTTDIAEYVDETRGHYRMASFIGDHLAGCLFIGPASTALRWDAMKALFGKKMVGETQRRSMLSGKSTEGLADPGPVICACFGVGLNAIRAAIASGAATTVEGIGTALRAGTNCGSCLPELKRIVA
jgi:assimilatory nitrate reductase catalytic subunit